MRTGPAFNRRVAIRVFGAQGLIALSNGFRVKDYLRVEHNAILIKNEASLPILSDLISAIMWLVSVEDTARCVGVAQKISNFCKGGRDDPSRGIVKCKVTCIRVREKSCFGRGLLPVITSVLYHRWCGFVGVSRRDGTAVVLVVACRICALPRCSAFFVRVVMCSCQCCCMLCCARSHGWLLNLRASCFKFVSYSSTMKWFAFLRTQTVRQIGV